jgi:hypothetical protein
MLARRVTGLHEAALRQLSGADGGPAHGLGPWTMDHGSAGVDQAVWLLGEGRPDQNHAGGARILLGLGMHPQLGRRGLFIFTAAGAGARVESAG